MGEEGGAGSGAAQVTVNFDIDSLNNKLDEVVKSLSKDNKAIIRDCVIRLFANTNFDNNSKSPYQIASDCVSRAVILAQVLKNENLID